MSEPPDYEYMDERNIDSALICSICTDPLHDPRITSCRHAFCYNCITTWTQTSNTTCPQCRRPVSPLSQAPVTLSRRLDSLKVKCTRCGQTDLNWRDFLHHIQNVCLATTVVCSASDLCGWGGQRDQLNDHLAHCGFHQIKPTVDRLTRENEQLRVQVRQTREENTSLEQRMNALQSESFHHILLGQIKFFSFLPYKLLPWLSDIAFSRHLHSFVVQTRFRTVSGKMRYTS